MLDLPFEHCEDLADRTTPFELYRALEDRVRHALRERHRFFADPVRRHYEIIARFRRFPHCNENVGSERSEVEMRCLAEGGDRF